MPLVMGFVVKQLSWTFWGWQLVLLLPALLCVRSLWHGKNAERLIWVALVLLIYLATVGSGLLNDSYQQAPTVVIMVAVLEFILLGWLLGLLLYFIKKLPAQHRL